MPSLTELFNQPLAPEKKALESRPGKAAGGGLQRKGAAGVDPKATPPAGTRIERHGAFVSQQVLLSFSGMTPPFCLHETDPNRDSDPRYALRIAIALPNALQIYAAAAASARLPANPSTAPP